ncbi:TIGR01777 family oxidoreductase [Simiduia agarivorans]|uniref:NAD-dependent epimerase/dehydratase n=1 Tax=Simiduia agarivorans (strain DSM 21679 / JCM 13881 / BCRC 17597 / SA1) TaxID=1117647 RepID=K4KI75_SIMAS|nr:TIGR01777 family oxidoreductase [Simiduia agarivorans]AFU98849.1 NAD-dependent epimerase/dehydratase [Simiduia agarivorans SA1 = DSM 21679]
MRILITGATGLIGSHLIPALQQAGHTIWLWVRSPAKAHALWPELHAVSQLDQLPAPDTFQAVINLAGEPIAAKHWTASRKQALRSSRIDLTRVLCEWLSKAPRADRVLLSGSAVGVYGDTGDQLTNEKAPTTGTDFASALCRDWEAAALTQTTAAGRVVLLRTGLVLSGAGGLLKQMRLPFSLGLGGRLGNGGQFMPWIHAQDYVRAVLFILDDHRLKGPINLCAPNPVTNREFARALAQQLHRPCIFPVPAWILRAALGELSDLLLTGQRCQPAALTEKGFTFEFATLAEALDNLL